MPIDRRWSAGNVDDLRKYAAELVALAPDAILANGSAALTLLLQATRIVPIVFTDVPDPVGAGFVDALSRPGGNATGFMLFVRHKRQMARVSQRNSSRCRAGCRSARPHHDRWGWPVCRNPVCGAFVGSNLRPIDVRNAAEIERGVASLAGRRIAA